jgi:hypothetical protein
MATGPTLSEKTRPNGRGARLESLPFLIRNTTFSEQIRDCLQHAEDCARQAAAQSDPKLKQGLLEMERR